MPFRISFKNILSEESFEFCVLSLLISSYHHELHFPGNFIEINQVSQERGIFFYFLHFNYFCQFLIFFTFTCYKKLMAYIRLFLLLPSDFSYNFL